MYDYMEQHEDCKSLRQPHVSKKAHLIFHVFCISSKIPFDSCNTIPISFGHLFTYWMGRESLEIWSKFGMT